MTAHQPGSSTVDSGGFALSGHTGRGWESWGCLCGRGEGVRGPYQCVQILDGRSEEEGARLLAAVLSGEAVGTPRCKKFNWNVRNAFTLWSNQEAGCYRGCGVSVLGDAQNLITGHPACSGWPTSEQWAGPQDLQRCLPTSTLPWKKILQFEMEEIQNKPNFAIC